MEYERDEPVPPPTVRVKYDLEAETTDDIIVHDSSAFYDADELVMDAPARITPDDN